MAIKSEQAVPANEIVVYQPNETLRLEVKLDGRTVWLSQKQMAELFGCSADNVGLHLKNIYADGELDETATAEDFSVVRKEGVSMLARHYGFTEEELDFIVNYDIKCRMGNAPESEARREGSSEANNGEAARKGPHELNAEE